MLYTITFLCLFGMLSVSMGWRRKDFGNKDCLDVAIVGGGISGTYAAWRLRNQGLKVSIFENTNRIGGRTFTVSLPSIPNVPLELGAMRYIPGHHSRLEALLERLGFKTKIFEPDQFRKLYYLRGKRLREEDLTTDKLPYNLAPGESRDPSTLQWNLAQRALNVSNPDKIPDIEEFSTKDGVPVYDQGYLSMMETVWSPEAKQYLKTINVFRSIYIPNLSAVVEIVVPNPNSTPEELWTVEGGFTPISEKLAKEFLKESHRHKINLNRRVHTITKKKRYGKEVYDLTMYTTKTVDGYTKNALGRPSTVCAKKVILAVPQPALKNIDWYPLQHDLGIQQAFQSLEDLKAVKIFLAYPEAWWDNLGANSAKAFVTDNPLRQGLEFGRFKNASGHEVAVLLAAYLDGDTSVDYFGDIRKYPSAFPSSKVPPAFAISTRVLEHVHHHLALVYGIKPQDIPKPLDGIMHIWEDDLNGGAWQHYNPGFKPKVVEKFMKRPVASEDVFIITNSYSRDKSIWTEGCLRAADEVLSNFFNLS